MNKFDTNKDPFIHDGWKIERHEKGGMIDLDTLSLHTEPEQEKGNIKGTELAERMKGKGLNATVLDYLLEHPELIPKEWKGKYVFFWGTIYRSSGGYLCVRYLYWDGGGWDWRSYWLDGVWNSNNPAAVAQSTFPSDALPSSDTQSLELRIEKLEQTLAAIAGVIKTKK